MFMKTLHKELGGREEGIKGLSCVFVVWSKRRKRNENPVWGILKEGWCEDTDDIGDMAGGEMLTNVNNVTEYNTSCMTVWGTRREYKETMFFLALSYW